MPFVIIMSDKAGSAALRAALRTAHLEYLTARQDMLLAGGGLLDGNDTATGGLIILDTEDRKTAEQFVAEDPFSLGGLIDSFQIIRWRKTFFDKQHYPNRP